MAYLQALSIDKITEAAEMACEKNVPLTVSFHDGETWETLHSRFLAVRDGHILVAYPRFEDEKRPPHEFAPADKVAMSFKLRHYKHIATATVVGPTAFTLDDGTETSVLSVCCPTKMDRAQRRAYLRVEVPPNRVVRASFWIGGRYDEPFPISSERPVWSGQVTNLSAGGFQLATTRSVAEFLESGEKVGVHMAFGASGSAIYADAQLRHIDFEGDKGVLGFQFLGLEQTREGRKTLQSLMAKVADFRRTRERANRT